MIRYIVTQLQSHHQKDTSSIIAPTLFDWNSSINLILMTAFKQLFFFLSKHVSVIFDKSETDLF